MNNENVDTIEEIKKREREKRDEEANNYIEFVENVYGPFRSAAYTKTVLQYLKLNSNETWLDAGSGVGRLSLEIAPKVKKLVCVDHSLYSLEVLRNNAGSQGLSNIETIQSDVCNYSGKNDYFDGILLNEVLQHIPTREERLRGVTQLYRALRPGGRCVINVIRWHSSSSEMKEGYWGKDNEIYRNYFTREELNSIMKEAGFRKVTLRGLDIISRRLSRLLPSNLAFTDALLSRIPLAVHFGNNIIAIGQK